VTDGVTIVDKPAGMTSHDVVDAVRARLGTKKVGHGGTLDPDATGVLVIGVGRATRFLSYAQAAPKRYEAVVAFGSSTMTQDASGEVVDETSAAGLDRAAVTGALASFTGDIEQIPPMVSAVKVAGERLYKKALRGEEVERSARRVTVYNAELTSFAPGERAEGVLDIRCSGGTYIRTLAHDLGRALGCGAHLVRLRRTEASGFTLDDAVPLSEVTPSAIRPLRDVVRMLPTIDVDASDAALVRNGRPLTLETDVAEGDAAAVVHHGELLGVYRREDGRIVAERVVPQ